MAPTRVLVTGGAGFVGSNLIKYLLDDGCHVTCVDNLFSGSEANLSDFSGNPNFKFIKHDVCEPLDIPCDKIFHLACPASPPFYQADPLLTINTCYIGTLNMLNLAKKHNAKMLYTSTSEIYGDPSVHPQVEEYWGNVNCRGPRSCYDEGKRAAETLCMEYLKLGVHIRVARLFNCYGPKMSPEDGRVVSNFIMQAISGEDITIYGDGSQTRSFGFVDDTVAALLKLIDCDYGGPVNIGNPGEFTIREFADIVLELTNSKSKVSYLECPIDDPKQRKPDISKAKKYLNWEPKTPLREGLKKTIPYFAKCYENKKSKGTYY